MNRDDIIDILTAVQAVDHRSIGETDITVWGAIIGKLPKDDALQAVVDHRRECPGVWLEPGHIHARVRAIQRDRRERMSLDELRAEQDRYDTRLAAKLLELAESKTVPDDDTPLRYFRPSADPATNRLLSVPCPYCKARPGLRCTNTATKRPLQASAHPARITAAAAPRVADRACLCGRDILDDADTCDRCTPVINGPNPVRKSGAA